MRPSPRERIEMVARVRRTFDAPLHPRDGDGHVVRAARLRTRWQRLHRCPHLWRSGQCEGARVCDGWNFRVHLAAHLWRDRRPAHGTREAPALARVRHRLRDVRRDDRDQIPRAPARRARAHPAARAFFHAHMEHLDDHRLLASRRCAAAIRPHPRDGDRRLGARLHHRLAAECRPFRARRLLRHRRVGACARV